MRYFDHQELLEDMSVDGELEEVEYVLVVVGLVLVLTIALMLEELFETVQLLGNL